MTSGSIWLRLTGAAPSGAGTYHYALGGHTLAVDAAIPFLQPYALSTGHTLPWPAADGARLPAAEMRLLHHSTLWIAGAWRELTCRRCDEGFRLDIAGVGAFDVDAAGQAITCTQPEPDASIEALGEAAIGPALMLALALQQTWTIHASAALIDGKLVAFAADSGTGKSTLARRLDELGMCRVADDILPITLTGDPATGEPVTAWPHFPQLKLPLDRQPSRGLPQRLPLHTLYQLDSSAPPGDLTPMPLSARVAATVLLRHTVAARLFDARLLRRHLDFAAQAVRSLRVCRLPYPRRLEMLPAVAAALTADLAH